MPDAAAPPDQDGGRDAQPDAAPQHDAGAADPRGDGGAAGERDAADPDAQSPVIDAQAEAAAPAVARAYGDVAPILMRHCAQCHSSAGGAPFGLTFYEEVVPLAQDVRAAIVGGSMPPCNLLGPDCGLSQAEVDTVSQWVEQGARR